MKLQVALEAGLKNRSKWYRKADDIVTSIYFISHGMCTFFFGRKVCLCYTSTGSDSKSQLFGRCMGIGMGGSWERPYEGDRE